MLKKRIQTQFRLRIVPLVLSIFLCLCSLMISSVSAEEDTTLIGAQDAINAIEKAARKGTEKSNIDNSRDARQLLLEKLKRFQTQSKHQTPANQAKGWYDLVKNYWELSLSDTEMDLYGALADNSEVNFISFLRAMPTPEAWPLMQSMVAADSPVKKIPEKIIKQVALKAMLAFFNADSKQTDAAIKELEELFLKLGGPRHMASSEIIKGLQQFLREARRGPRPADTLAALQKTIKSSATIKAGEQTLKIPDLLNMTTRDKAKTLISETIALQNVIIQVPAAGATLDLLKEMLAKEMDKLQRPQWHLINHPDDWPLFESMQNRFPGSLQKSPEEPASSSFSNLERIRYQGRGRNADEIVQAKQVYLIGLIASDQVNKAVQYMLEQKSEDLSKFEFGLMVRYANMFNSTEGLYQFCDGILQKRPDVPLWTVLAKLAITLNRTDEVVRRLDQRSKNEHLSHEQLYRLHALRIKLYLATNRINDAKTIIHQLTRVAKESIPSSVLPKYGEHTFKWGEKLFLVGKLQEQDELMEDGLALMYKAKSIFESVPEEKRGYGINSITQSMVEYLIDTKRYSEAQQLVIKDLVEELQKAEERPLESYYGYGSPAIEHLTALAKIYNLTGRHQDTLLLLEKAPWWGCKDLLYIDSHLILYAADALHAEGRSKQAVDILKHALLKHPSDDAFYQTLVNINPPGLIGWLDKLYILDRFEERPLIWKAQLLLHVGKHEVAEKVIRQALKVDPTDGEQRAGDRVRAYAVLANILKQRGKVEDAAFFDNVVESVRIAEKGDEFNKAGLIQKSLELYTEAEVLFGDAYCVQWRMAERLYELGKFRQAQDHYRIAFERMPEQFGQVASFCFGCEGVFDKQHSRSIAENVLLRLEKEGPERPQVHFLLGQLRNSQHRYSDAYGHYQKAVQVDRDYLDAWEEVYDLHQKLLLAQVDKDLILLEMIRLDPLMKHFSADLEEALKVKEIWSALNANRRFKIAPPAQLMMLKGSVRKLEVLEKKMRDIAPGQLEQYLLYRRYRNVDRSDPGLFLATHKMVAGLMQLIQIVEAPF